MSFALHIRMADALPISSSGYSRAEVRRAADTLLNGGLIALPGETGYMVAASPLDEQATTRAARLMKAGGMLLVSGDQQARDYIPQGEWPQSAERLAHRCWPGPVILSVATEPQQTLFGQLPEAARSLVSDAGELRLACSGHAFTRDVAAELPWPLLVCREIDEGAVRVETPESLRERFGGDLDLIVDAGPPPVYRPCDDRSVPGNGMGNSRRGDCRTTDDFTNGQPNPSVYLYREHVPQPDGGGDLSQNALRTFTLFG